MLDVLHLTIVVDAISAVWFGALCAAAHWIVARAEITRPLWSRARGRLDRLLRCAGCSGFWLGAALAAIGMRPVECSPVWLAILLSAILAAFLTPVLEGILLWGLDASRVRDDHEGG